NSADIIVINIQKSHFLGTLLSIKLVISRVEHKQRTIQDFRCVGTNVHNAPYWTDQPSPSF
ncbi:hypothetical protein, partial [Trichormus variabilis]|uniref:hypothetical protein n=1 Tax=Anabaena variabilis TaxID=264691 RepID=UPI001A91294E